MFPIKYIENNLVFNHDGECFAYYELTPYNYSFLSPDEKYMVHDNFRQLIAQNRDGKIHALQIATEDSLRAVQERSKKGITGRLKEIACKKVDEQTEALVEMIGENQIDYRFFLGFKLLVNEEEINLKSMKKSAAMTFTDFIYEVNHKLMSDFVSMSNDEVGRFMKMEKLLESKISRRFQFRRLDKNDFGYLLEHIYGNTGVAYSDYSYDLPVKKLKRETLVKRYDLIRPTKSASKRGIVDKKAVSKQPQSEKQNPQRPIVDKTQKKQETQDKERQDNGSATKAGTAKGTAPLHERPVTTPVSAKAAPQSAGSKEEQNIKERPTTVKREQSQSARAKEPVTKQQEVRTQVARESSSPAATPKHSGTVTDMPRQTVKHQKQTKTVQKKATNPSTMKKTTSRKGGKK